MAPVPLVLESYLRVILLQFSINSYQPSTGPGTPTRSTPRGTPRLYGSIHSAAGSYTNKFGGFNSSPAAATND